MSEGYLCDRCGSTHGGTPDTMLLIGDGRPRTRRGIAKRDIHEFHANDGVGDVEFDLCRGCRNDLRKWWAEAGGDPSDIEQEDDADD